MSAPQMQQAIATIDRLVAGGSLSPEQAQILTQQAQQMRNALNP
jgi:Flp pilus assembly CpaF family ATPase